VWNVECGFTNLNADSESGMIEAMRIGIEKILL
jgi:hypothetical protein